MHYRARPVVRRKIDPYHGIIEHRLAEFPKLSSVRLYIKLQAPGYPGGYTQVKEYERRSTHGGGASGALRAPSPLVFWFFLLVMRSFAHASGIS